MYNPMYPAVPFNVSKDHGGGATWLRFALQTETSANFRSSAFTAARHAQSLIGTAKVLHLGSPAFTSTTGGPNYGGS